LGEQPAVVSGVGNLSCTNFPIMVARQVGLTDNKWEENSTSPNLHLFTSTQFGSNVNNAWSNVTPFFQSRLETDQREGAPFLGHVRIVNFSAKWPWLA
jgi:hypothetical protein